VGGLARAAVRRLLRPPQTARLRPERPQNPLWRDFVEISGDWLWETDADLRFVAIPTPRRPASRRRT
jgi:hypothetical protein